MDTPQEKLERARQNAPRFDEAVRARMVDLGITTFQDLADLADITVTTLSALRKGQNYPHPRTAWKIDGALRWQRNPSSTIAIFKGRDPVALPDKREKPKEDPYEARIRALPSLSQEKKNAIIAKMRADRQAEIERAEALDKLAQAEGPKRGRSSA